MEAGRPRELGVVHRKARDKHKVVNGVLVVRLVIGDNRRERDFASRTGGSGNRNKQRQETMDAQQAAHLVDGLFGCAMRAPTPFAQSMAEPPPKPIMAWQALSQHAPECVARYRAVPAMRCEKPFDTFGTRRSGGLDA